MRTFLATLAAIVIILPAVSSAQHCQLLRYADDLELTDQQIEQLTANTMAQHKKMIQHRADMAKAKLELHELMMAENLDKSKIMNKAEEISKIKAQMEQMRIEGRVDRLNILTDDQRAELRKDLMLKGPRHGKRGHGMRGHDGWRGDYDGERQFKRLKGRFGEIDEEEYFFYGDFEDEFDLAEIDEY